MVSSKGGRRGFVYRSRHRAYRALRRRGLSKTIAAQIANEGRTFPGRSRMARKSRPHPPEERTMTKLTTKRRRKIPKSQYGLPGRKAYPMPDRRHAANAKARATQMYRRGKLSKSARDRIHAKANRKLKGTRKRSTRKRRTRKR